MNKKLAIGFALDGNPIYGDRDLKGKEVTAKNLDLCNGINNATPDFPKGIMNSGIPMPHNAAAKNLGITEAKLKETLGVK